MVVVRQWPMASSLTVLNPGEYTARSDTQILRDSEKIIKLRIHLFLGMRLPQSTLTGFLLPTKLYSLINKIMKEWWCCLDAGLYTPNFHNAGLKSERENRKLTQILPNVDRHRFAWVRDVFSQKWGKCQCPTHWFVSIGNDDTNHFSCQYFK